MPRHPLFSKSTAILYYYSLLLFSTLFYNYTLFCFTVLLYSILLCCNYTEVLLLLVIYYLQLFPPVTPS